MKAKSELWGQKLWLFIEVSVRTVSGPTTPAGARRAYECTRTQRTTHTHTYSDDSHATHFILQSVALSDLSGVVYWWGEKLC